MAESALMAAGRFCFHQQQRLCKEPNKEFHTIKLGETLSLEVPRSSLHLRSNEFDTCEHAPKFSMGCNQLNGPFSHIHNASFIDVQDDGPNSVLFSSGIAEQCERHERILRFLSSGSTILDGGDLDPSVLSDLMGIYTSLATSHPPHAHVKDDACLYESGYHLHPSFVYPQKELYSPETLTDIMGDFSLDTAAMVHPNGQSLYTGTKTELNDFVSMIADFYLAKKYMGGIQRREMVVPYFRRSKRKVEVSTHGSVKVHDVTAPVKRPEEMKVRSLPSTKQAKKTVVEKDLYKNNFSLVCESLLSLVLFKDLDRSAFITLKKHNHELFQLLTQFSAGIAGTGLAILFSVIWKIGNGRMPFCTSRILSTGLALTLFWLSFAVNALRDTIIETTKTLSNMKLREDGIMDKVERSAKEVIVRSAAVAAVALLRLA